MFVKLIRIVVWLIMVLVWTLLGFALWVPFLTRLMAVYMAAVMGAVLLGHQETADGAQDALEEGINFYSDGFYLIYRTTIGNRRRKKRPVPPLSKDQVWNMMGHLAWTVTFWFSLWGLISWKLG